MATATINNITFNSIPSKAAGTNITKVLRQSDAERSSDYTDYLNGDDYYPLVNAVDIDWNGAVLKIA